MNFFRVNKLGILGAGILFLNLANASSGPFVEPGITTEYGRASLDLPRPFGNELIQKSVPLRVLSDHSMSAAYLEETGKLDEAADAYKTILKYWPNSLSALIGLGNVNYTENDLKESLKYLRLANKIHPESAAVQNNLKFILQSMK